jgi:hypothetical protein
MSRPVKVAAALLGIALVLLAVGGPAAVASYGHAIETARKYGEEGAIADWLPLTTDGMLLAALVVMYARRWRGDSIGFVPKLAFITGSVATLAANLSSADIAGPLAAGDIGAAAGRLAVAAWPPIAFAVTLELVAVMLGFLRRTVDTDDEVWPVTHYVGIPVYPYRSADEVAAELEAVRSAAVEADRRERTVVGPVPGPGLPSLDEIEQWGRRRTADGNTRSDRAARRRTAAADRTTPAVSAPADRTDDEPGRTATPDRPVRSTRSAADDDDAVRTIVEEWNRTGDEPSARWVRRTIGAGVGRSARLLGLARSARDSESAAVEPVRSDGGPVEDGERSA